ncbi:MAG: TlpA disulfide reductase family protein [Pseudomonadota bacterium]
MIKHALVALTLYAGLVSVAIASERLTPQTLEAAAALRAGEMRKLVIHAEPKAPVDVTFLTVDGAEQDLHASAGKIRIVNFWATWCAPCKIEKPKLDALNQALGGAEFEVVAIATGRNSPKGIKRFNEDLGITSLTTYLDPRNQAAASFGVIGLPVSVVIDREGREIGRLTGAGDWNSAEAQAIFRTLIAGSQAVSN